MDPTPPAGPTRSPDAPPTPIYRRGSARPVPPVRNDRGADSTQLGYPQLSHDPASYHGDGYGHPPTAEIPAYQPDPRPRPPQDRATRRSNVPLVAVIIAVSLLLCAGTGVAGMLVARAVTDKAAEVVKPLTQPPPLPTVPTDLPNAPGLPTGADKKPGLPRGKDKVTVVYEVRGDGPVDIVYVEQLGDAPKRVSNAKLPWRTKISVTGATVVSVTAVRTGTGDGSVSCATSVDGERVSAHEAQGRLAIVTCGKLLLS